METIPATTTPQVFTVFWEYTGIEGQCTETGFPSHYAAAQYIADHADSTEPASVDFGDGTIYVAEVES